MRIALRTRELTKKFSNFVAVNKLSFQVREGSIHGFLGPNGAGKSTTLKMLTGLIKPTSGSIIYFDEKIDPRTQYSKEIGYLPENLPLYEDMSVYEYLKFVGYLFSCPSLEMNQNIEKAILKTNLIEVTGKTIGKLSKGFKQRVGLASTLVYNPKILILDEPTSGLDPHSRLEVRELIKGLKKDHTILLSSHMLHEMSKCCDDITIINNGNLIKSDSLVNFNESFSEKIIIEAKVRDWDEKRDFEINQLSFVNNVNLNHHGDGVNCLTIEIQDLKFSDELSEALFTKKCGVLSFGVQKNDLENTFMNLTSKRSHEQINSHR